MVKGPALACRAFSFGILRVGQSGLLSDHPDIMMAKAAVVFDKLGTLADATRARILLLLEGTELTVGELCLVLQLPQSTVSRHLKILSDEGWVSGRDSGASRFYTMVASRLDPFAKRLWH